MLGLIIRNLNLTENRLVRRTVFKVVWLGLSFVFFIFALAWGSVALFFHLAHWLTPLQAGLAIAGSALLLSGLTMLFGSYNRRRKSSQDEMIETIIAALARSPAARQERGEIRQGSTLPEKALVAALIGAILYGKSSR
jgi:membrane protein implicated in regulation of membrane protease activity